MSNLDHIEIRSDEVQEILGTPPRWIVRWGITIMLLVVMVLLCGSYLFKYPDLITARVIILSENPPVQIVAKSSGKLDHIFVENNQFVDEGELLGVIENPANYSDAYALLKKLDSIECWFEEPENFSEGSFGESYSLGQYHSYYSAFIIQVRSFQTFLTYNPFDQRIKSLQKQIIDYRNYFEKSRAQISVLRQDYELAYSQFSRDSLLHRQQIMSEMEFEKSKAAMLKQKYSWQNAISGLANTQITMNNLQQQILEQEVLKAESASELLAVLKERFENLTNQLKEWEQAYILKSPISGKVTFTSFWSPNQFVVSGNVVFTVVPSQELEIIGRAIVPIAGAGKIEAGQRVNIKLDNYPHMEYGIVPGEVANISMVPVVNEDGAFYTAEIKLSEKLNTNYNRELPFSQEMQGVAEIVTKDKRLIERLVEPLVSLVRERM
ncbi:MAG: HlyD family efflux transporter periplasmic adaptor subunit [Mariniphaga sp.]|nr:HlyD family efflux transporter periplasmic adaptor subunit [Mariniphaga sp.]